MILRDEAPSSSVQIHGLRCRRKYAMHRPDGTLPSARMPRAQAAHPRELHSRYLLSLQKEKTSSPASNLSVQIFHWTRTMWTRTVLIADLPQFPSIIFLHGSIYFSDDAPAVFLVRPLLRMGIYSPVQSWRASPS